MLKKKNYFHSLAVGGNYVLHLGKTWEKLMLAARMIVAVENKAVRIIAYMANQIYIYCGL